MLCVTIQRDSVNHSSSNGQIIRHSVPSSDYKHSWILIALSSVILVIGSLNYLQLQQLRFVYEAALSEPEEVAADLESSLKPRVWIQGKRVQDF